MAFLFFARVRGWCGGSGGSGGSEGSEVVQWCSGTVGYDRGLSLGEIRLGQVKYVSVFYLSLC